VALPVPEASFPVTWAASDGSSATITVRDVAVPPAPSVYEVTTRMGFVRRVHVLAADLVDTDVVRLRAVPGHEFPVDAVSASPPGALEFLSYPSLPFPNGLTQPQSIAVSWAEPTPHHLSRFSVVGISGNGANMTVAVPGYVHAFVGQADARFDLDMMMDDGSSLVKDLSYAAPAEKGVCAFEVAWVKDDGSLLALFPSPTLAFPAGPGALTVFGNDGTSSDVRFSQAGLKTGTRAAAEAALVHVTAVPGDIFSRKAKHVEFECVVLRSKAGDRFPKVAVEGPISVSWARPPPSESDRPIRQRRTHEEADRSGRKFKHPEAVEADDAAGGAGPSGAFPFQYTITRVSADGDAADVFVPEGLPVPEFVSSFEITCDLQQRRPELLWAGADEHRSVESGSPVQSIAEDGADMVLGLAAGTAFPAGPGLVQLTFVDGSSAVAPYESAVPAGEALLPAAAGRPLLLARLQTPRPCVSFAFFARVLCILLHPRPTLS